MGFFNGAFPSTAVDKSLNSALLLERNKMLDWCELDMYLNANLWDVMKRKATRMYLMICVARNGWKRNSFFNDKGKVDGEKYMHISTTDCCCLFVGVLLLPESWGATPYFWFCYLKFMAFVVIMKSYNKGNVIWIVFATTFKWLTRFKIDD